MTDSQLLHLAAIRAELSRVVEMDGKATPGPWITGSIPWKVWANGGYNTVCNAEAVGDARPVQGTGLVTSESMAANRDFIAASRLNLPASARSTLAMLDALEAELAELEAINDGRTHWDGCEKQHGTCAAAKRCESALLSVLDFFPHLKPKP